ncbi:MAG TPA: ATP-binding protein [Pyrinomonadaceae bacterium]|nr:ATP-binding protein [Pyrinomonadaceae bacterium]
MSTIFLGDSSQVQDILRKSAKNQLDSYAEEWIVVFEAVQNALDAVEEVEAPHVRVVFDIAKNRVSVLDNGNGFPTDKEYFGLGKGSKFNLNKPNIRGEHGVGIKMVLLCSQQFELITRHSNKLWYARFNNGYAFLEQKETEYFEDDYPEVERLPEEFNTLVEYSFPSSDFKPLRAISVRAFLRNLFREYEGVAPFELYTKRKDKTPLFIEHYFRTHSYTGDVNRLFDDKKPARLEIIIKKDDSLSDTQISTIYPNYLVEHWKDNKPIEFPSRYWDVTDLYENPSSKGFLTEDMLKSFNPNRKFGDSRLWAIKITDKTQMKDLLINPDITDYYAIDAFDNLINTKINGIYMVIASASKSGKYNINKMLLGKPNQIIAADGIITTNQIRTPKRGRNQNYLNNIHFVININERVNYGKQGVKNPKLLSEVYNYFEEIYIKRLVELAVSVAGKQSKATAFEEPEIVITDLIDLKGDISIKKEPWHESTLIAILYELIGKGIITGIDTYHLSSFDQYDGKINMVKPKTKAFKKIERDDDLMNLEFKVKTIDLIDDFENGVKDLAEIGLAVIWDRTLPLGTSKYHILDIEDSKYEGLNIPGVKDVLSDMDGNEAPLLDLKSFLEELQSKNVS